VIAAHVIRHHLVGTDVSVHIWILAELSFWPDRRSDPGDRPPAVVTGCVPTSTSPYRRPTGPCPAV